MNNTLTNSKIQNIPLLCLIIYIYIYIYIYEGLGPSCSHVLEVLVCPKGLWCPTHVGHEHKAQIRFPCFLKLVGL